MDETYRVQGIILRAMVCLLICFWCPRRRGDVEEGRSQEYTTTYLCSHLTSLGKYLEEVRLLKLAMSICLAWTWVSHLSHWAAIKPHLRSAWSSQHRAWFLPPEFSGSSGLRLRQETILCRKSKVSTDLCPRPLSTLTNTVLGGDNATEQFSLEIMRKKKREKCLQKGMQASLEGRNQECIPQVKIRWTENHSEWEPPHTHLSSAKQNRKLCKLFLRVRVLNCFGL